MSKTWRQWIKKLHPEGIPWPGSLLYNAISESEIFRQHYALVARDVARYKTAGRILDVGTGPGKLLFALRQALPDAALAGVDISSAMVAQAGKNIRAWGQGEKIDVRVAGADDLPFDDNSFDCVVSTGSLHHWKSPVPALDEAYRVLKPHGYALMYDLVRNIPGEIRQEVKTRFGRFRLALLWLHSFEEPFLSPQVMEQLGRQSRFEVEGTRFVGALCCLVLKKH